MKMNLKNKLKYTFGFVLMFGFIFLWTSSAFADTQIYPAPGYNTPYGDGANNTTNAGWTDNHMVGQTIQIPSGVGKITKVRLDNFELNNVKQQGVFSVALFAGGAPGVTKNVATAWDGTVNPLGGTTTQITPPGAIMVARLERVFIAGRPEADNVMGQLCGASEAGARLLSRLKINNPTRPCPTYAEWDRLYAQISPTLNGTQRDEFYYLNQGTPYRGHARISGDSQFLWQSGITSTDDLPPYFEGPGLQPAWQSWGGGKNEIPDISFEATLPSNVVNPGQTYFLSIQGSHDFNTKGTGEGEYWETGGYNCDKPNEPGGPVYFSGFDNATGSEAQLTESNRALCSTDNVIAARISNNNPYLNGQAYFNTVYYYGGGDVTDLTIWGVPPVTVPTATIIGPGTGLPGLNLTFNSQIFNAQSGAVYVTRQGGGVFTCPPAGPITGWCLIRTFINGSSGSTFDANFTFQETGTYQVVVNAFANSSATYTAAQATECSGNPYASPSIPNAQWSDCGPNDNLTVTISAPIVPPSPPPPTTAPSCNAPANGATLSTETDPSNLTFTWGTVAYSTSYSFKLDYLDATSNWQNLVNKTGIPPISGATSYTVSTDAFGNPIIQSSSMLNLRWQVWANNAGGDGPVNTCTFSLPRPSLFLLDPTSNTGSGAVNTGPANTSGLRSDDPNLSPGTTGQNYRNTADFKLKLLNAGLYNTFLEGIAFAGSAPLTSEVSSLYTLTKSANATNGFVIIYNPSNTATTEWYYDPTWTPPFGISPPPAGPVWTFNARTYHIYYQGKWNVNNNPAGYTPGSLTPYSSSALTVKMTAGDAIDINNPIFEVTFWKPLGSRTWGTYGYLKQKYYQSASDQYFSLIPIPRGI